MLCNNICELINCNILLIYCEIQISINTFSNNQKKKSYHLKIVKVKIK